MDQILRLNQTIENAKKNNLPKSYIKSLEDKRNMLYSDVNFSFRTFVTKNKLTENELINVHEMNTKYAIELHKLLNEKSTTDSQKIKFTLELERINKLLNKYNNYSQK